MGAALYKRLLGVRYGDLAGPLREMHDVESSLEARGAATIERGEGLLSRVVAELFRFPRPGQNVPLTVTFSVRRAREHWRREFGGKVMASVQEAGRDRWDGLLLERFGPMSFAMRPEVADRQLHLHLVGGAVFGIALPSAVLPTVKAFEHDADGRFNFHVELGLPVIGRVVRYHGWLEPVPSGSLQPEHK